MSATPLMLTGIILLVFLSTHLGSVAAFDNTKWFGILMAFCLTVTFLCVIGFWHLVSIAKPSMLYDGGLALSIVAFGINFVLSTAHALAAWVDRHDHRAPAKTSTASHNAARTSVN